MTVIESRATVHKPLAEVYSFLADLNNHQKLMPDNISNWSSTTDEARFTIQNMAKLALKVSSRTKDKEIVIVPSEEAPFDVELKWTLTEADVITCRQFVVSIGSRLDTSYQPLKIL